MNQDVRISVLESRRLVLRPLVASDAEQITALLTDPTVAQWTNSIPWPYTIDHARVFLKIRAEADLTGESFVWGIVDRASGVLMGTIGLHEVMRDRGRADLGYWIGLDYRGKGYTTEAARRVLSWAFEAAEYHRIQATYLPGNEASEAVIRAIGMQLEGLLRGYAFKNGEHLDLFQQAVLCDDGTWMTTDQQLVERRAGG